MRGFFLVSVVVIVVCLCSPSASSTVDPVRSDGFSNSETASVDENAPKKEKNPVGKPDDGQHVHSDSFEGKQQAVVDAETSRKEKPIGSGSVYDVDEDDDAEIREQKAEEKARLDYISTLTFPFDDAAAKEYFGIDPDATLPVEPKRLSDVSREEFFEYAIRGEPIIVTDGMRDWPGMGTWNCQWFHQELPNESVVGFTSYTHESLKWIRKLGDPFLGEVASLRIPDSEADPKNPSVMSWYYSAVGISGVSGRDVARNETAERMIIDGSRLPYFVEPSALNEGRFRERLEFFFGASNAGVHPHTDPVCDWIMSGQLSGSKFWRLSVPYNIAELERVNPGYKYQEGDGHFLIAAHMNRHAIFEARINTGEMLVFPPGMIHSTRADSAECSTSTSVQFAQPLPVDYMVRWSDELVSDSDGGAARCFFDRHNYWLFGTAAPEDSDPKWAKKQFKLISKGDQEVTEGRAAYFFGSMGSIAMDQVLPYAKYFIRAYDANKDGKVTLDEFADVVVKLWSPTMQKMFRQIRTSDEGISLFDRADIDRDGRVNKDEGNLLYGIPWQALLEYDADNSGDITEDEWDDFDEELAKSVDLAIYGDEGPKSKNDPEVSAKEIEEEIEEAELESEIDGSSGAIYDDEEDENPALADLSHLVINFNKARSLAYFGSSEIDRVADVSAEYFAEHYGHLGKPVIVTDGTRDWPQIGWSCSSAASICPNEQGYSWVGNQRAYHKMADIDFSTVEATSFSVQGAGGSLFLEGPEGDTDLECEEEMIDVYKTPYFAPQSDLNERVATERMELIMGTKGAKVGPETHVICYVTFFAQMTGSTRWRLAMPYNVRTIQEDNPNYKYHPLHTKELTRLQVERNTLFEFTLNAGEVLVLPAGFQREYTVVSDECSTLLKSRYTAPAPVHWVKHFREELISDVDGPSGCFTDHYNYWLFGAQIPSSDGSATGNAKFADETFAAMDADGDGFISLSDATKHFEPTTLAGQYREAPYEAQLFLLAHDSNEDGRVSRHEFDVVMKEWTPVMKQVGDIWYYVDTTLDMLEDSSNADYSNSVDSIRFRYDQLKVEVKDEEVVVTQPKDAAAEPATNPPDRSGLYVGEACEDEEEVCFYYGPASGTGIALKTYADHVQFGNFRNFEPIESEIIIVDVEDGATVRGQELAQYSSRRLPWGLWIGPTSLTGFAFLRWDNGVEYAGPFLDGARVGRGIACGAGEFCSMQDWYPDDDAMDWKATLGL